MSDKILKELLFDSFRSKIPQPKDYSPGTGISIDGDRRISIDQSIINDILHLKECCDQAQVKFTEIHLALQKIKTDYYTKAEMDEIIKELRDSAPAILGLTDAIVDVGDTFDPLAGVTAIDGQNNDITSSIVVTGTVDTSTAGEYTLTYSVTDGYGYTTTEMRKVIVELNVYHTTLFTDGTLIINEKEKDRAVNIALHGAVTNEYAPGPYSFTAYADQPWAAVRSNITRAEFGSSYKPTSCAHLFNYLPACTEIDLSNLDTSDTTDMAYMFSSCGVLTTLDVSGFNTSNVTTMRAMFNCKVLPALDVSGFDTSNVTDMAYMFLNCSALTELDVSGFDTSAVTTMEGMFSFCAALSNIDVSGFNTSEVTSFRMMFNKCESLASLDVTNFDTSKATSMEQMFNHCSFSTIDVTNFNTSSVTSFSFMFSNCSSLTSLDVTNFDTSNATTIRGMFTHCSALTSIDVTNFNTSKATRIDEMFSSCSDLTFLDVTNFDTSKATNMNSMFRDCTGLTSLDLANFDTRATTSVGSMFDGCTNLVTIYADATKFTFPSVTTTLNNVIMFDGCNALTGGRGTKYSVYGNRTAAYARIDGGTSSTRGYFTAKP